MLRTLLCAVLLCLPLLCRAAGMGVEDARHLLIRTGFLPTPAEISDYSKLTRKEAIERLLDEARDNSWSAPVGALTTYVRPPPANTLSEEEKKLRKRIQLEQARDLRVWWVQEMLATRSPLAERMALFWHNHFVSSLQKVKQAPLLYQQHLLFRREALGNFGRLLHAVAKDPAMVLYLDVASSRKDAPNENFAREVMELFTLGEGHYTEADIKDAARAFTGWGFDREFGQFVARRKLHDDGIKTVLGRSGRFDGDAVLDILLEQRHTSEWITTKLWREFISPKPDKDEVARLARRFYDTGHDIRELMRELLGSPAFWARANRNTLVKSPVDLVVGSLRGLQVIGIEPLVASQLIGQMGQSLFAPPNVKGWPGGEAWIDSSTLLKRREFLTRVARRSVGWQQQVVTLNLDPVQVLLGTRDEVNEAGFDALLQDPRFQLK